MILYTKQTHRIRTQTYGYKGKGGNKLGVWD